MTRRYLGGYMRPKFGFITSWESETGEVMNVHRTGPLRQALRDLITDVLALDPTYRLISYSTPDTILTDMLGRRRKLSNGRPVPLPEAIALGSVDRLDLLHPRFDSRRAPRRIDLW